MDKATNHLPVIAVYGLTGCAGELLVILENLANLLPHVRLSSFPFAQSANHEESVDIAFVEGTVSQPHDLECLKKIRNRARWLVAVGNCAVWGCVQHAAAEKYSIQEMNDSVYGPEHPTDAMPSQPLDQFVRVDVKLSGCPINATQLLSTTASLLKDHLPYITHKPVCLECKLRENACVLIENNLPCLGPVTAAGCGALCPSVGAACYGCWGPCEDPQMDAMALVLREKGFELSDIMNRLQTFGAPAKLFERVKGIANV